MNLLFCEEGDEQLRLLLLLFWGIFWSFVFTSKKLFDGFFGSLRGGNVHELVDVVDDVSSDKNVATKVPTVHAANRDRWTVQLVVWQFLQLSTFQCFFLFGSNITLV